MYISHGTIDLDIEKKIITSLIVSERVANELVPITTEELFTLDIAKVIFSWIKKYHEVYKNAPGLHIQDIYTSNRARLKPEDDKMIAEFLTHLSSDYENSQWKNEAYLLDQGKKYLRKRHLIVESEQIKILAESDMLEEAEKQREKYNFLIDSGITGWCKPFDDMKSVRKAFLRKEEEAVAYFGGVLDNLIGPLRRAWLMLILGPMKRGKTRTMLDIAIQIALHNRKVSIHSLEMEDDDLKMMLYQALTGRPVEEQDVLYPVFDCVTNQRNSCNDPIRINRVKCPTKFVSNHPYKPCRLCLDKNLPNYQPTTWFIQVHKKPPTFKEVKEVLEDFHMQYGRDCIRLKSYPVGSVNIQDIGNDLSIMEQSTGWKEDVIIIDYADILKPEQPGLIGRDKENEAWKALKGLAQKRKSLVITGTQGNRASFEAESLEEKNTSEDIRKLAHIDLAVTLNQTDTEKEKGIMRIGILNHRWRKFYKKYEALLLQCPDTVQFNLDSMIVDMDSYKKMIKGK